MIKITSPRVITAIRIMHPNGIQIHPTMKISKHQKVASSTSRIKIVY